MMHLSAFCENDLIESLSKFCEATRVFLHLDLFSDCTNEKDAPDDLNLDYVNNICISLKEDFHEGFWRLRVMLEIIQFNKNI